MKITEYSKNDTLIVKGCAIILIMLHNLYRWITPITGENEFDFSTGNFSNFINCLQNTPLDFINIIFSFLGHFGVQAFILFSGYGLTKSFLSKETTWIQFSTSHIKKVFVLLLLGIVTYYATQPIFQQQITLINDIKSIPLLLLFVHTLTPDTGTMICGPWWFLGLIVQLYLIFPLIVNLTKRFGKITLLFITIISYIIFYTSLFILNNDNGIYITQNAPAHLPEFCLGIWLALTKEKKNNIIWLVLALIVFCLGNVYEIFYPLTFISVCIIFVFIYQLIKDSKFRNNKTTNAIKFIGSISMLLFITHGFIRTPFLNFNEYLCDITEYNIIIGIIIGLLYIICCVLFAIITKPIYNQLCKLFNKIHLPRLVIKHEKFIFIIMLLFFSYITLFYSTTIIKDEKELNSNINSKEIVFYTNGTTSQHTEFSSVLTMKQKWTNQIVFNVEFDAKCNNGNMPLLVFESNISWSKFKLEPSDTLRHYSFKENISIPFYSPINNKVKIYFWNNSGSEFEFQNFSIRYSN